MQDYSETSIFLKEVFQNTSRAVHAGEPREGLCFIFSRAVLCIQVLIQFRSVNPKCSSGGGYIFSMEGANFLT